MQMSATELNLLRDTPPIPKSLHSHAREASRRSISNFQLCSAAL